jgi:hypothetical protein
MQRVISRQRQSDPTPAEIREKCLLIQDQWSERERSARLAGSREAANLLRQWTVHQVRVAQWE